MIGTIVVTHGRIGEEMVRAVLSIVKDEPPLRGVCLEQGEDTGRMRRRIQEAIQSVDQGEGILLLSDMFGGTPSNICLSFLEPDHVEVITGVNLPMLIKIASFKEKMPLSETADFIRKYGQKNIARADEVLQGKTH